MIQGGKTDTDKQRYRCRNPDCSHQSFLLNSAYEGRSPQIKQQVIDMNLSPGKRSTQQINCKYLTLRTRIKRLVRKTICFSKSIALHDIVIGLFINRYEFGLPV